SQQNLTPAGKINGTINIDSGTPEFTRARVSSGDYTRTVFEDGTYSLYAPFGSYSLTAEMRHYTTDTQNNVNLSQAVHTLDNINFDLLYLAEPTALNGTFNNRELTLSWTAPTTTFTVNSYNVYRKINNGNYLLLSTSDNESYVDDVSQDGEYFYYVEAVYPEGIGHPSIEFTFDTAVALDEENHNQPVTVLFGNYPNPFNPTTTISYSLANEEKVKLEIFNVKGQLVKTLVNEIQHIGRHSIEWNGKDNADKDCASGLYMYRFQTKGLNTVKKAMLLK
ncbi:MAG: T9SS type A sorting domain-containing protein, partial [Candidatus Cloacimonetes bacterium]|nr:T9SS type A sorting domain-containing protein [Candidatus Cloacimonadota bacterium]